MRTSIPVPTLSLRAIVLGICTAVVLMGITRHSFANVDPQAPYSNVDPRAMYSNVDPDAPYSNVDPQALYSALDQNGTIANADPLSPPG